MIRFKKFVLKFAILLSYQIFCHEIEFYSSQSLINQQMISKKQPHNVLKLTKNIKRDVKGDIKWRTFSEENVSERSKKKTSKRATDPVFHGHPKTREEMWNERFLNKSTIFDQTPSLIKLIHNITLTYLNDCTPVILYDSQIKSKESYLFQNLLKDFPVSFVHGFINNQSKLEEPKLLIGVQECLHFIVFLSDVDVSAKVLGKQSESKVVVIARSSQWAVQEFLSGAMSRIFVNLLVVGQSFQDDESKSMEAPYILYTHNLYTDGLGASLPVVLNSWSHGKFSRELNLFPPKMRHGYAGHRFLVAAANKPPFVIKRIMADSDGGNPKVVWDGIEIRLLKLLAERNNFSIEIIEPSEPSLGPGDAVSKEIILGKADIGIAGMYITKERMLEMDMAFAHSQDCATFLTIMSTALPRYRAILGPFHWTVWVALTLTYLFGIFPLAFSDKHTLRHLLHNSGEVENMFWYVFGTFTNCFTFVGKNSWSKTTKITTRLLIGWYWLFTIIITSCYTGSIIAFVTLPVFPETVDTIKQLLLGFYRVGTLDKGGWEKWFFNSSDPPTNKLLHKLELVPNVEAGVRNVTKAFFWPYAFLGSQAELEYIVQSNFTTKKSKRAVLHISDNCFVPFGVSIAFPNSSLYSAKLNSDVMRIFQSGILNKIVDETRWAVQRSAAGKMLAVRTVKENALKVVSVDEKGLTLEDTQGMFLLLGAGFIIAGAALLSEWMGGCTRKCRSLAMKAQPSSAGSQQQLLPSKRSRSSTEVKDISDDDRKLNFDTRSTSAESKKTLNGQVIHVTQDNITVHNNLDSYDWEFRSSSSADLDREIREIFEKDRQRRLVHSSDGIPSSAGNRQPTASKGIFGDHLHNTT